ncbi:MAG: DivIVA domain-containing protein [Anaerotignum sp.]|nr:DivIVA domain-containing protein [Anaerotignum sp.]
MVTPNDIATKDFKKVAVGYSPEEVDTFLDDLFEDYERLYTQSMEEKTHVKETTAQTDQFSNLQKTLERTLTLAEAAAEETKAAAKEAADMIVKDAKLQAEELLQNARTRNYEMEQELIALQNRYELMRTRVKLLLYAEIELLDKNEILAQKDEERKATE